MKIKWFISTNDKSCNQATAGMHSSAVWRYISVDKTTVWKAVLIEIKYTGYLILSQIIFSYFSEVCFYVRNNIGRNIWLHQWVKPSNQVNFYGRHFPAGKQRHRSNINVYQPNSWFQSQDIICENYTMSTKENKSSSEIPNFLWISTNIVSYVKIFKL